MLFGGQGPFGPGPFGQGAICVFGRVIVVPTGLIGAVNGYIITLSGVPVPFTQVVGPAGGLVSANMVNGQFATVCGTITTSSQGQPVLNVSSIILGTGTTGATGTMGTGLNAALLALLQQSGGLGGLQGLGGLSGLGNPGSLGSLGSLLGAGL